MTVHHIRVHTNRQTYGTVLWKNIGTRLGQKIIIINKDL